MDKLATKQANRRVEVLRPLLDQMTVRRGWIHYMRHALGMKLKDLARLTGLSPQTVYETEKREANGKVTLTTLRKMARAMDCNLVYAFVPEKEIGSLLQEKAIRKASEILSTADTHMILEDQAVQNNIDERVTRLAEKLLERGDVW